MELARHSDMWLTMKVYSDVGQLPLASTAQQLPGFKGKGKDTQIDAQKLVPDSPAVSPLALGPKSPKVNNSPEKLVQITLWPLWSL
jgi:hypothetical protein